MSRPGRFSTEAEVDKFIAAHAAKREWSGAQTTREVRRVAAGRWAALEVLAKKAAGKEKKAEPKKVNAKVPTSAKKATKTVSASA